MSKAKSKLSITLSNDQLKALKPIIEQTGKIKIAGEIEKGKLNISFIACNAAFLACNAPFKLIPIK